MKRSSLRLGEASLPRARIASTSPVSPTTPTRGLICTSPLLENLEPSINFPNVLM
ncbi:MAG: hypothetical protein M0Z95_26190 [Actinomycetota bacterium]|nr:hypothetical protein [Actinomycetota bacterium]